ncbi:MAG TPA: zf-HC2 domain-containing protein [Actinomycetota bacterium]
MSDRPYPPADHPEELLAGYVDGSATSQEREAVEAHLVSCQKCREEAGLATAARTALASLPQMDPPGLARLGLPHLRGAGLKVVPETIEQAAHPAPTEQPRTIPRGRRTAWVPALAAAAIVVIAGLISLPFLLRGGGGAATARSKPSAPAPSESPVPALVDVGASYTPATLSSLATRLAPAARLAESAPTTTPGATQPAFGSGPTPGPGRVATGSADRAESRVAQDCLVAGGGLEQDALPVYLEAATFKGVPAYIGAFARPGSRLNLVVVAVSRGTCQPLYTLSRPA